jgi:hypothetical protein
MKMRSTLLAAALAGLWCTAPMAQNTSNPTGQDGSASTAGSTGSTMNRSSGSNMGTTDSPNPNKAQNSDMRTQAVGDKYGREPATGTTTNSPNPNKAQNSHMRTQAGSGTTGYAVDPQGNRLIEEPTASSRRGSTNSLTNSPNPNKAQNSGMRTQ